MLITFEGLDCSGKTTQAKLLVERLSEEGEKVLFLREPGGTDLSERIRSMLLDKNNSEMSDITELLLFSAARAQLVNEVILPALKKGEIVVCDRFYDSTTAYQGWGRGIDLEGVQKLNTLATGGLSPDLTFYLDIDLDEVERRKALPRVTAYPVLGGEDRLESSGREFYKRVREGYLELSRLEAQRFVSLDGTEMIATLRKKIWQIVQERLERMKIKQTGGP